MGEYLLVSALVFILLALATNLLALTARKRAPRQRRPVKKLVAVGAGASQDDALDEEPPPEADGSAGADDGEVRVGDESAELVADAGPAATPAPGPAKKGWTANQFATAFTVIGLALVTVYLGMRMVETGHGPFSNQHEFAVSFTWGILVAYLVALWKFKTRMLSVVVLPVAACLLLYSMSADSSVEPLVPALQNNLLLTLHVGFAILSYGAACVSFAAAVLYLVHDKFKLKISADRLDEIGYKGAVVAFPLMTIMIVLGSLWAETAWGRYWGWDPKETAALVTWLLYGAFLHARVSRGWRGRKSAWLLVIGFAAVLFAYFGNLFFGGLHSYA
ncbi:MAG: cytochrome c biogenesis protein CcsA [Propionibacteriaceae bacterium]|nr:cytochrome c biogenesis protein CcsA [Propionibacteriaceae bacterium]